MSQVIAAADSSNVEAIEHDVIGLLVKAENAGHFCGPGVLSLVRPGLPAAFRHHARVQAMSCESVESHVAQIAQIYKAPARV